MKINLIEVNKTKVFKIFFEETEGAIDIVRQINTQAPTASNNSVVKFLTKNVRTGGVEIYSKILSVSLIKFMFENMSHKNLKYPISIDIESNVNMKIQGMSIKFNNETLNVNSQVEQIKHFIETSYKAYELLQECFNDEEKNLI